MTNFNKGFKALGFRSPRWFKSGKAITKTNTAKSFGGKQANASKKSGFHNGSR